MKRLTGMKRSTQYAAIALTLTLLSACGGKAERIEAHLRQGNVYLQQADWDKASVEVRNVLQMDPKRADAYTLAAKVEEGRKEFQKAFANYSKAVELKPEDTRPKAGLARIYLLAGQPDKADEQIGQMLKIEPANLEARTLKAALLARRGDSAAAIEEANLIIASAKTVPTDATLLLAGLYVNQGEDAKGLQLIEKALQSDPKNIQLLEVAGEVSGRIKGDEKTMKEASDKAVHYYQAATAVAPKNIELWNVWARFHASRNEVNLAEKVLRDAIKAQPEDTARTLMLVDFLANKRTKESAEKELLAAIASHPKEQQLRFGLVNLYRAMQRTEDAVRVLNDVVAIDKDGPSGLIARNQLAAYQLSIGQVASARKMLDALLKVNPRDGTALILRGRIFLADGNAREAIIDLRAAAKDQPNSPEVIGLLAQAHRLAGEAQLAHEVIADAVKQKPDNLDLHFLLAEELGRNRDYPGALAELDTILKAAPRNVHAYEMKASLQLAQKDPAAAEATMLALKMQYPTEAIGYLRAGQVKAEEKKYDAALLEYDAAARIAPRSPEPVLASIGLLVGQKKFDDARRRISALIDQQPNNAIGYQLQGEVAMAQKKFDEAESAYRKVITLAPNMPNGYQNLSQVFIARNDLPSALSVLEQGEKANPKDISLSTARAEWLSRSGQYDQSIGIYESLLKRAPENDFIANNLAYLLTEVKGDKPSLDRALLLTQKFSDSANPGYVDSLGWTHYKLGQYDQAIPLLQRASDKADNAPLIQMHLGLALYKKGDVVKAKELLGKVIESKANLPNLDEVKKILAQG